MTKDDFSFVPLSFVYGQEPLTETSLYLLSSANASAYRRAPNSSIIETFGAETILYHPFTHLSFACDSMRFSGRGLPGIIDSVENLRAIKSCAENMHNPGFMRVDRLDCVSGLEQRRYSQLCSSVASLAYLLDDRTYELMDALGLEDYFSSLDLVCAPEFRDVSLQSSLSNFQSSWSRSGIARRVWSGTSCLPDEHSTKYPSRTRIISN